MARRKKAKAPRPRGRPAEGPEGEPRDHQVKVNLTASEYERLADRAGSAPVSRWIRDYLIRRGVI